jgi:hypothetical protein
MGFAAFAQLSSVAFAPVKPTATELNGVLTYKSAWEHMLDNRPSVQAKKAARRATSGTLSASTCGVCTDDSCAGVCK